MNTRRNTIEFHGGEPQNGGYSSSATRLLRYQLEKKQNLQRNEEVMGNEMMREESRNRASAGAVLSLGTFSCTAPGLRPSPRAEPQETAVRCQVK